MSITLDQSGYYCLHFKRSSVFCGGGCRNTTTLFPVDHKKREKKGAESGFWEVSPLYSPVKRQGTEGEGRVKSP